MFVDDAVRGTLPPRCVKDGVATTDSLRIQEELGDRAGLGVAWLLLLAGPLGWLGLLLVSAFRGGRRETLHVEVPLSEPAYRRLLGARRLRRRAVTVAVLGGAMGLLVLVSGGLNVGDLEERTLALAALAAVVGGLVVAMVADARVTRGSVGVDLDASRRWVTLDRVHPDFAAACQVQDERHPQRT